MSSIFLQGNSRDILKGLPANFFHCAVTSPPYFGLRKYDGGIEVWDGGSNCQHEWGRVILPPNAKSGAHQGDLGRNTNKAQDSFRFESNNGQLCSVCGAWRGQLGAEPTPELYVQHLVEICREVRRVLRPDGVFWLNIGDSWSGSNNGSNDYRGKGASLSANSEKYQGQKPGLPDGLKALDMVLIPSLLALALRADGWYVRSKLVWAKGVSGGAKSDYAQVVRSWSLGKQIPGGDEAVEELISLLSGLDYNGNPMPESVNGWRWERCRVKVAMSPCPTTHGHRPGDGIDEWVGGSMGNGNHQAKWTDCPGCPKCSPHGGYVLRKGSWRPTDSYEFVLMLTKTSNYYCDKEVVLEPVASSTVGRGKVSFGGEKGRNYTPDPEDLNFRNGSEQWGRTYDYQQFNASGGRNLRSVLCVPTTPYKGAHFATFAPRLIEPLIKAATSEKGCCLKCGAPWARVIEKGFTAHDGETDCKNLSEQGNTRRLALLCQAARKRGFEYGSLSYDSKHKEDGITGLATRGFQRDETIEAERERGREEARLLFPGDERAQQDYVNRVPDHGGLSGGRTLGWLPTCSCGTSETVPCCVLDPFSGAGTTALVCERFGLSSFNIDTSAKYNDMARARLVEDEARRIGGTGGER